MAEIPDVHAKGFDDTEMFTGCGVIDEVYFTESKKDKYATTSFEEYTENGADDINHVASEESESASRPCNTDISADIQDVSKSCEDTDYTYD